MQRLTHAPKRIVYPAVLLAASVLVLAISMQAHNDATAEASGHAIYKPSEHVGSSPRYTASHAPTHVHTNVVTRAELYNLTNQHSNTAAINRWRKP